MYSGATCESNYTQFKSCALFLLYVVSDTFWKLFYLGGCHLHAYSRQDPYIIWYVTVVKYVYIFYFWLAFTRTLSQLNAERKCSCFNTLSECHFHPMSIFMAINKDKCRNDLAELWHNILICLMFVSMQSRDSSRQGAIEYLPSKCLLRLAVRHHMWQSLLFRWNYCHHWMWCLM